MAVRLSVTRVDSKRVRQAPGGGIVVPAVITKSGIFEYRADNGAIVSEYRPQEEVTSEETRQSFAGAPVTDHHHGMVTPDNFSRLSRGHVSDRVDANVFGEVETELYISDRAMVDAVLSGERSDVSSAYDVVIEETPGEVNGHRYDRIQRKIRGNHVALLPSGAGRLGTDVSIRLDSEDDAVWPREEAVRKMTVIKYRGIEYRVDGADAETLLQAIDAREGAVESALGAAEENVRKAQERADALDNEVKRLQHLTSVEALDARAQERAGVIDGARRVLGETDRDFGAISNVEIMKVALGEGMRADASDDYVRGAFEARVASAKMETSDTSEQLREMQLQTSMAGNTPRQDSGIDTIYEKYCEKSRNAWQQKLAIS